ncbi:MAG: chorismate synthase [Elusimicrobia bacterium RIFOXYC2_FULL_34_12]|nr:MAG: chorismate synthase [Elusimicrobia bacterium RIFOXYC2_FULL_34_12]HAM39631.1 chorismate synthase [Elusimicrobiota bacterium]
MIRYITAGESHGKHLTAIIEGIPAGLELTEDYINIELARRQKGFGRGKRMQSLEKDKVSIVSGVRYGKTIGSPITMIIPNKDWENNKKIMSILKKNYDERFKLTHPRPGHADLAGIIKYNRNDIRDILERASARETAARVAVGAVCKKYLNEFDIKTASFVTEIGGIIAKKTKLEIKDIKSISESSEVRCLDKQAEKFMIDNILKAEKHGDTLGGVFTVIVDNVPVGLGSYIQWDLKLDARLAYAVMSIQAIKGVEIGGGFDLARRFGSQVHDEIFYDDNIGYFRKSNNAGGIEGGISNGQQIIVHAAMKPIPSLTKPLKSVDIKTKKQVEAQAIRSDVCAVPAAAVVGEAVVSIEVSKAFCEKFGGDSINEVKNNYSKYLDLLNPVK